MMKNNSGVMASMFTIQKDSGIPVSHKFTRDHNVRKSEVALVNCQKGLLIICLLLSMNLYLSAAEKTLSSTALLIGATAEAGSSDKEGLFDWKNPDLVQKTIQNEFGLVQTTSYPAWGVWTGSAKNPKSYDLTNTNKVINWAYENHKKVSIHLLSGSGTYFPDWFNSGTWTNAQLEEIMTDWISGIITTNNNAGKVDYWNVVNEAFTWDGKYWATEAECRWQQLGWEDDKSGLTGSAKVYDKHPVYIRKAFEIARSKTDAKLELRDYYIEFWDGSVKARAFYQLVKHLLNCGVPIDAVGFQGHFRLDYSYDWVKMTKAISEYKKLGLEVYITEVDYGDTDHIAKAKTVDWSAEKDSVQKKAYYDFAKAAVAGGVDWICFWGVADNTNAYWRMGQCALLFNEKYQTKAAYEGFLQGAKDGLSSVNVKKKDKIAPKSLVPVRMNSLDAHMNNDPSYNNEYYDLTGRHIKATVSGENMKKYNMSRGVYLKQPDENVSAIEDLGIIR